MHYSIVVPIPLPSLRCRDARYQRGRESGSGKYSDHYTQLGRSLLEPLLAADPGYRGPRAGCRSGHQAGFVCHRVKTIDTVLGPVTVRRAWYHCARCERGFASRGAGLGVAGQTTLTGSLAAARRPDISRLASLKQPEQPDHRGQPKSPASHLHSCPAPLESR